MQSAYENQDLVSGGRKDPVRTYTFSPENSCSLKYSDKLYVFF